MVDTKVIDSAPVVDVDAPTKSKTSKASPKRQQRARNNRPRRSPRPEGAPRRDLQEGLPSNATRIQISNFRTRIFYARLARIILAGYNMRGEPVTGIDTIEVTALGAAISNAILIAEHLKSDGVMTIESVATEVQTIDVGEDKSQRRSPRIVITLKKTDGWTAEKDSLLSKSRVYQKVLNKDQITEHDIAEESARDS